MCYCHTISSCTRTSPIINTLFYVNCTSNNIRVGVFLCWHFVIIHNTPIEFREDERHYGRGIGFDLVEQRCYQSRQLQQPCREQRQWEQQRQHQREQQWKSIGCHGRGRRERWRENQCSGDQSSSGIRLDPGTCCYQVSLYVRWLYLTPILDVTTLRQTKRERGRVSYFFLNT